MQVQPLQTETSIAQPAFEDAQHGVEKLVPKQTAAGISLPAARIAWLLLTCAAVLLSASFIGQLDQLLSGGVVPGHIPEHIAENLHISGEDTIPSWFSTMMLSWCALLLGVIAVRKRQDRDRFARYWIWLAIIFLLLSMDEAAALHELTTRRIREFLGLGGFLYLAWVVPASIAVGIFCLIFLKFLWNLPGDLRRLFIIAGVIYVGGALCLEMVAGWHLDRYGKSHVSYTILQHAEETMEMLGVVIFIYALLKYIRDHLGVVRMNVR